MTTPREPPVGPSERPASPWAGASAKAARALFGLVLALFAILGVYAFAGSWVHYPRAERAEAQPRWLRGAYHVHSLRSHDGRGSEKQIVRAAKDAGLDFVILTEHDLAAYEPPRFVDGVLLITGSELSTPVGHLVALPERPDQLPAPKTPVDEVVRRAAETGTFLALAHPVQRRHPWRDSRIAKAVPGFELYSYDTLFREVLARPASRLIPSLGAYFGQPLHGVMQATVDLPQAREALLDQVAADGDRVSLCALDAHGLVSYPAQLGSFAEMLDLEALSADAQKAATEVISRIASGRAFCGLLPLGDPSGVRFLSPGRRLKVGDRIEVRLPPAVPEGVQVRVFGAGALQPDGRTIVATGPGALEVEVWAKAPAALHGTVPRPWIVPSAWRVER